MALGIAAALLFAALASCGRGHRAPVSGQIGRGGAPLQSADDAPGAGHKIPDRTALSVIWPSLAGSEAGAEFDVAIRLANPGGVFQGCGRLVYDAAMVEPVSARRGAFLPSEAVAFVKTDVGGYVPYAFTGREGSGALPAGEGDIFVVRFRLKSEGAPKFGLRNEAEFLQLRNDKGQRIPFDLATEVTAR
jgi:hypothetical protein